MASAAVEPVADVIGFVVSPACMTNVSHRPGVISRSDPPPGEETHGILWLASYPKSGNTWTRNFLHNLLNILEGVDEEEQNINKMNELTFWEISGHLYEKQLGKPITECTREEIAAVRPKVQEDLANKVDGLALVKTHHALVMNRGHPLINFEVTAGAVYIVRNPLDVAVSLANHIGGTIDEAINWMAKVGMETAMGENAVYEVYSAWSEHVESWTRKPHEAIYVMRYEDMLDSPTQTFRALAGHLLLNPSESELNLAIERSSFDKLKKQEEEGGFAEKPKKAEVFFRSGRAGDWRDKLTVEQIERIVRRHHKQMARFGYLTDELKHLVPSA